MPDGDPGRPPHRHAAGEGGETLLADASRVIGTLAYRYPDALRALCAAEAAVFGADAGPPTPVCAPAAGGRMTIHAPTLAGSLAISNSIAVNGGAIAPI